MLKIAEDWIQTGVSEVITLPTVPQPLIFAPRFCLYNILVRFFSSKIVQKKMFPRSLFPSLKRESLPGGKLVFHQPQF